MHRVSVGDERQQRVGPRLHAGGATGRRLMMAIRARFRHAPTAGDLRTLARQLRGPNRASAVRGFVDGLLVTCLLRWRGVRPVLHLRHRNGSALAPERSRDVSAAVDAGLALIPAAPTCLRRSVTLLRELDRLGLVATLHIGVRNVDGKVEAHAWVQAAEVVLNDEQELIASYIEMAAGDLERLVPLLR